MMRGLGFVPDRLAHAEEDRRQRALFVGGASRLPGVGTTFAASRDWRHFVDRVSDQGPTNVCVAAFVSNATYLAGAAQGRPIKRPSVLWPYALARWTDLIEDGVPVERRQLVDLGCRPRSMMTACEESGLVAEREWPFNPADVNVSPPFGKDVSAAVARLTGWYVIGSSTGSADQMRAALDARHFPGLALDVYSSFDDCNGVDVYDEPRGQYRGSHMVTVVGYRPGALLILNSWGTTWGDSGYAWLSDRFVESHYVRHRVVVTAAPDALAAAA